jgi:hypothetical protein
VAWVQKPSGNGRCFTFSSIREAISYCGLCGDEKSSTDKVRRTPLSKQPQQTYPTGGGSGEAGTPAGPPNGVLGVGRPLQPKQLKLALMGLPCGPPNRSSAVGMCRLARIACCTSSQFKTHRERPLLLSAGFCRGGFDHPTGSRTEFTIKFLHGQTSRPYGLKRLICEHELLVSQALGTTLHS